MIAENTPAAWNVRASEPTSWGAALWSERGQTQRFLAVLRHLELREGDTLLDFGCGTGRLAEFVPGDVEYYAHDWAPVMLERVRAEHPRAEIRTELGSSDVFDHVVCVGTFNLADRWSIADTFEHLAELYVDHTARTLAVSLYRGDDVESLRYGLEHVEAFLRVVSCHRYLVDASYLPNDLLLVMWR